jgi:uroporphyrinogen-III decarboxylase
MTPTERVMAALRHEEPDRVPIHEHFWAEFVEKWRRQKRLGDDADINGYYELDICSYSRVIPDQSPWPSKTAELRRSDREVIHRTGWGALVRDVVGETTFSEQLEPGIKQRGDLDGLDALEPAALERRYDGIREWVQKLERNGFVVVTKSGGPFSRTWKYRGMEQFLVDMIEDPAWVAELLARQTDLLIETTLQSIRRGGHPQTFVWIADDCAYINGPLFSPAMYERLIQPQLARMCEAFHATGRPVAMESEGDIRPLIDLILDAGVDAIANPELRAGMDVVALRRRYGHRAAFIGAMCNTVILPTGSPQEIRAETRRLLAAARGGGLIMGSGHTIGADVPVASYEAFRDAVREFGTYPLAL